MCSNSSFIVHVHVLVMIFASKCPSLQHNSSTMHSRRWYYWRGMNSKNCMILLSPNLQWKWSRVCFRSLGLDYCWGKNSKVLNRKVYNAGKKTVWYRLVSKLIMFAMKRFSFLINFYAQKMIFQLKRNHFINTNIIKVYTN